jgi:uracil-DNA glycosylase family 4
VTSARDDRIELLREEAKRADACRRCRIGAERRHNVYGEGDPFARLMVIGEGPGETEDQLGRPFVGRAGELLNKMLAAIRLAREEVYICNVVKCRATLETTYGLKNRAPDPQEIANCRPFLERQLEIVRPHVVLLLGAPAAKSFLGTSFQITKMRGRWYDGPFGTPMMVTFHPAYVLRQTGGEIGAVKRLVWNDLKEVRAKLDEPPPQPPPEQETLFDSTTP